MKIANICGSNGRIAVPLAVLGADVTIFDISAENRRYASELASCAEISINYELCDFYDVDLNQFGNVFDMAYLEGGILHYFHDINWFTSLLHGILKPGGRLILSDFHPFRIIYATGYAVISDNNYFDSDIHDGDVAYKNYFPQQDQADFPDCSLRFYTLSEILNAVIRAGFFIREFNEHPKWDDKKIPGEFTIYAIK